MKKNLYRIAFEVASADGAEVLSEEMFTDAIAQALPKEMWYEHREEEWGVTSVFTIHWPTDQTENIERLQTQLTQELRLANLQEKYNRSLGDWTAMRDERDKWRKQSGRMDETIEELEAEIAGLENRLHEALVELEGAGEELGKKNRQLAELVAEVTTLRLDKTEASDTARRHETMVQQIVNAMTEAGYEVAGWGNDADMTELEENTRWAEDSLEEVEGFIRSVRSAVNELNDYAAFIEDGTVSAKSNLDNLSRKLDNMRTMR